MHSELIIMLLVTKGITEVTTSNLGVLQVLKVIHMGTTLAIKTVLKNSLIGYTGDNVRAFFLPLQRSKLQMSTGST